MVSVHNTSLFDELKRDAAAHLHGGEKTIVGSLELGDELADQFEEAPPYNAIAIDTVNPKELMSSASKYFASRTSPRSEASSIDQDLLDSARSTRSISSVISQRHHGRLYFPDKRTSKLQKAPKARKHNGGKDVEGIGHSHQSNSNNISNGTQRIMQRVVEGRELLDRRRHAARDKLNSSKSSSKGKGGSPTARNTSPIRLRRDAISENIDESSAESLQRRQKLSPPQSWDTTKPLDYSPQPIKRLSMPRQVPVLTKEERIFQKARERNLRAQNANRRRKEMEDKKIRDTEIEAKNRFKRHEDRVKSRKEYEAVERRRRLKDREDRALANMESYFAQRSNKMLTAALKQSNRRGGTQSKKNQFQDLGSQSSSQSEAQSRHTMHSLAKKRLAIMEQDRLDKLLRRVEEQDRRIEKLEREKALARRRHADLRAREGRNIGYRAQWTRRNRGGLRTAGVSCMNEYKYSRNRASSAMSSTSDQGYGGMVHRTNKGGDTYSLSVPRSAPANRHENRRNPDASGNEGIIIHRKDSRWFTEADEHDGVTDVEVCENPDEFYRREHQQTLHQAHINKTENSMPTLNNAMLEDRNDDRSVTNLYAHDKSGYTHQQTCETNQASGVVADLLPESLNELGDSEEKGNANASVQAQEERTHNDSNQQVLMREEICVRSDDPEAIIDDDDSARPIYTETRPSVSNGSNDTARHNERRLGQNLSRNESAYPKNIDSYKEPGSEINNVQPAVIPYGAKSWYYIDVQGVAQGPFTDHQMLSWHRGNFFTPDLRMRRGLDAGVTFKPMGDLFPDFENAFAEGQGPCPAIQHTSRQYTGRF